MGPSRTNHLKYLCLLALRLCGGSADGEDGLTQLLTYREGEGHTGDPYSNKSEE